MGEHGSRGSRDGSAPLSNSWSGMGRRDKGAPWPTMPFAGMWSFLWLREEVALCMREQAELNFLGQWRLPTWELSILSSALLLSFLPARRKEQGEDRKPAFCLSLQQTSWGALAAVVGPGQQSVRGGGLVPVGAVPACLGAVAVGKCCWQGSHV